MQGIYLDYAAATPLDEVVLEAMRPFFSESFYNPSAIYGPAVEVSRALRQARLDVANIIGAKPPEIIFTAGGTEANNLAIQGVLSDGDHVVYSAVEHDSVREVCQRYSHSVAPVNSKGIVDIEALLDCIKPETKLVSVMYVNNEIGTVQPVRRIAQAIEEVRQKRRDEGNKTPLYFHTDAAQAANYFDLHISRLGVDLMTVNGGKIYGPKQSGILFVKTGVSLKPLLLGGGQERGLRSGTENVAHCVGFAMALTIAQSRRNQEGKRLKELQTQFMDQILSALPDAVINGSMDLRTPNNLNITFPGVDNERLLMELDMQNIYVATGSACSASSDEPSHVLGAIGLPIDAIQSSMRFSFGRQTTTADIDSLCGALATLAK
jgi:cysteine desulfurase